MDVAEQPFPVRHWEFFRTSLLWAFDTEVKNIYSKPRYGPHPIAAWWLKRGSVTLSFGKTQESYEEGNWIFPRGREGTQSFSPDARIVSIRFFAEWPNGFTLFDRTKSISFPVTEAPLLTKAAQTLLAACPPQDGKSFFLNLSQFIDVQPLFNTWISAYFKTMTKIGMEPRMLGAFDEKTRQVLFYLRHRTTETPLHDKELAAIAGLSISQLHRVLARELGVSPLALWDNRRLEISRFELHYGKESIKSISFKLGFSSPEHFCTWFKRHSGSSPSHYRETRH